MLRQGVEQILQLFKLESTAEVSLLLPAEASLKKVVAPTFEIVFAGAFSAGKSMLINALLGRELLYSAEGHATGTECRIAYAGVHQERVVLTFMSVAEIREQVAVLSDRLGITAPLALDDAASAGAGLNLCRDIIRQEGGESKSERAKQASALRYLLQGFADNQAHIAETTNQVLSMEEINFSSLQEAASYARRGSNSAVLRRVDYFCHHSLLEDGNVLVDTPGIDAPVKADAALAYGKVEDPETSAVVCVLKSAATGDMTSEETELLEKTRRNPGIRDRVFYLFNRIDETWYNAQLRQRLEQLLSHQFSETPRVYQTSGLLGFYGSQIKQVIETGHDQRFGLDSLFADSIRSFGGAEETPQFVSEFNRYCGNSGKLPPEQFRVEIKSYESPNENYVRILQEQGLGLIEQLILDSGVEQFQEQITRYLREEKHPQLLSALAEDLQPICLELRRLFEERQHHLASQPNNAAAIKERELYKIHGELREIGAAFQVHLESVINQVVASDANAEFEASFHQLQSRLVNRLDELIDTFSVGEVHRLAQQSHRRNSVVPLLGILAEAFYVLANGLEETLVEATKDLAMSFFEQLRDRVTRQDYYQKLHRLLGNDGGIELALRQVEGAVVQALMNEARTECDRYVRERPAFFDEQTASLFQLQQTLQQACQGYDYQAMVEAEPAIRQLLKMDFEDKVRETVMQRFRQTINQTLNTNLLASAENQVQQIAQQYEQARSFVEQTLEQDAAEQVRLNQMKQADLTEKMETYEAAVQSVNDCLRMMSLSQYQMPALNSA